MKHLNHITLGFVITLVLATGTARAAWTPPEASITPPAVVTLDAFAATGGKGANPNGPLVVAPDGALYGSTSSGGTNGTGTLFRLTTGGAFTNLFDFDPDAFCGGPVVVGPNGALYCKGEFGSFDPENGFTRAALSTSGPAKSKFLSVQ